MYSIVHIYIYIYSKRIRDRVKITQHSHTHTATTPLLLLLRVERSRVYKSLYEVCCCSSSFKRPHIYVQFLNWVIYIVYARVSTYVYVCACARKYKLIYNRRSRVLCGSFWCALHGCPTVLSGRMRLSLFSDKSHYARPAIC